MAVFRSDQAQLTFASEAAQGGDMERLSTTVSAAGYLATANNASAGDTSITVTSGTYGIGDFVRIGNTDSNVNSEVRRVEHVNGTILHLDRPLAFAHAGAGSAGAGNSVQRLTGASTGITVGRKYITFVPGVYETVDCPDPEMAIEPRYFLGTQSKRNFFQAYRGQQTFSGSVGDMVLLNGWPLRFPIGAVVTVPTPGSGSERAFVSGSAQQPGAAITKGDIFIMGNFDSLLNPGDVIVMDYPTSGDALPSNNCEVRKVAGVSTVYTEVDYPFMFNHATTVRFYKVNTSTTGLFYKHHLMEKIDLDTVSWHVHMRDSGETAANDFDRRYVGGMVGSMTLSAEEGGLLTCGWDTVPFMDMMHNQKMHTGVAAGYDGGGLSDKDATDMPGFAMMQSITASDVNKLPGDGTNTDLDNLTYSTASSGSTDPYYFSRGSIKFLGQEFARIRNFTLSIGNNEEPRYYIKQRFGRHRGPSEIREQQREYTMSASVALPDSAASATASGYNVATALFKELLLEGTYGTDSSPNMKGFQVSLEFVRGTNDRIVIDMPGMDSGATTFPAPGTPATPAIGGNNQGVFIRTAPHSVSGENPMQTEVDMLIRNIKITVEDNIPVYP